jgi:glycosyltransferase involved in cell wall biosynthesis
VRVLYFGTYSVGPGYPRNTVLVESLRATGARVVECRAPLFRGTADKVRAVATAGGAARAAARAARAWAALAPRFFRAGPRDAVIVGSTGHLDVFFARALSIAWRRPIVLDAFVSLHDTVVGDRGLLRAGSPAARALFALERGAMRCADLVLADTEANADFLAETFDYPRARVLAVPVGSLVTAPVRVRATVGEGGGGRRPFTALFVGSYVPLQGVPYILDAAALAPDVRFRIVGDGQVAAELEREARARGMTNVAFTRRFLSREELEPLYEEADAVLGIFGTTPKASRVIPCKVYDGLAAGLPVVTGDSPAARELLTDGVDALLVDRGDPRALAAALRRLRADPALDERLRASARRLARARFSREAIGLRLRGALERLVRP